MLNNIRQIENHRSCRRRDYSKAQMEKGKKYLTWIMNFTEDM